MKLLKIFSTIVFWSFLTGCEIQPENSGILVLYSGRSDTLVAPVIELFTEETGLQVEVRYGGTAELAATILEEGQSSPADVFWAQDPGGLGAIAEAGMFATLAPALLDRVPAGYRAADGSWVGISGRARVIVYNTDELTPADLPLDIYEFIDPVWDGRIGWAPTNGSFQVMVTGMRQIWGEEKTRLWLEGILANHPVMYENNTAIVAAVAAGEVSVGFANHYYLYRFLEEQGADFTARNHFLPGSGPGSLIMVSGAGVLKTAPNPANAQRFLAFLLSQVAQEYFAGETFEYPLIVGVDLHPDLTPLTDLSGPPVDAADLADLAGTVSLLQSVGVLP